MPPEGSTPCDLPLAPHPCTGPPRPSWSSSQVQERTCYRTPDLSLRSLLGGRYQLLSKNISNPGQLFLCSLILKEQ